MKSQKNKIENEKVNVDNGNQVNTVGIKYQCDGCHFESISVVEIEKHAETNHKKKVAEPVDDISERLQELDIQILCEKCNFRTIHKLEMVEHIKLKHISEQNIEELWINCDQCDYKSKSSSEVSKHVKTFHFNCDQCEYKAGKKTLLTAHKSSNHKTKPKSGTKTCDVCEFTSTNVKGLNKHKAEAHVKNNICSICDKPKVSKKNEWESSTCKSPVHIDCMKVHGKERLEEFKKGLKQYNCVRCKEKSFNINQKSADEEVTEIEDLVSCNFCSFATVEVTDMEKHIIDSHRNLMKHSCSVCKKEFDGEDEFKIHLENACHFKCKTCAKTFKTNDMLMAHSISHADLVDEIVNNVEKHLEAKCKILEETLASERAIIKKNLVSIEELKLMVKKADERTKTVNNSVIEKDKELVKCKNMLNKEICENEKKSTKIIELKLLLARKDKDINDLKEQKGKPSDDTQKQDEEISNLKKMLEETRDLCLEYNHKIENIRKDSKEQANKLSMEKMKVEEELRSAILEKNLLRDSKKSHKEHA